MRWSLDEEEPVDSLVIVWRELTMVKSEECATRVRSEVGPVGPWVLWWRTPDICIRRLHPFWFTFCRYSWCHGADFFQRSHQEIWRLGCASLYRQHVVSLHHHGGKHPSACPMQRKGTPWNVSYYGLSSASLLACFTPRYTMGIHNQCLPVLCTQQCFRSRDHRSMQC